MVCLNCVERTEITVWMPKQAYDFFNQNLKFESEAFSYELMDSLRGFIDAEYPTWPKAKEIYNLLDKILREMNS